MAGFKPAISILPRDISIFSSCLAADIQNAECGNYTLYAYNSCDSMIVIRSGEKWLAFNEKDPAQTQLLYESIVEKMMK